MLHEDRVLLIHHARGEWRLPKGRIEAGEKPADAARREVEEETGVLVRVEEYAGTSTYSFIRPGVEEAFDKTIYWFAAAPASLAEPAPQLDEGIDEATWVDVEQGRAMLTFPTEREVLTRVCERRKSG